MVIFKANPSTLHLSCWPNCAAVSKLTDISTKEEVEMLAKCEPNLALITSLPKSHKSLEEKYFSTLYDSKMFYILIPCTYEFTVHRPL